MFPRGWQKNTCHQVSFSYILALLFFVVGIEKELQRKTHVGEVSICGTPILTRPGCGKRWDCDRLRASFTRTSCSGTSPTCSLAARNWGVEACYDVGLHLGVLFEGTSFWLLLRGSQKETNLFCACPIWRHPLVDPLSSGFEI